MGLLQVTVDIHRAMQGDIDTIFIATVVMAHEALAHLLAPFVQPHHLVVLNPGNSVTPSFRNANLISHLVELSPTYFQVLATPVTYIFDPRAMCCPSDSNDALKLLICPLRC